MNSARHRFGLFALSLLGVLAWFWWNTNHNASSNFLPRHAPAGWILYPTPPDTTMRQAVPLWTSFQRHFELRVKPAGATLELRGFRDACVIINNRELPVASPREGNWKNGFTTEVSEYLQPGTNQLRIVVTNHSGPPALWAVLRTPELTLATDPAWSASLVGAAWQPATVAGHRRALRPGNPLYGGETAGESVRCIWPVWLIFLAMVTAGVFAWRQVSAAPRLIKYSTSPHAEWWFFGGVSLMLVILLANNLPQLPGLFGFDTDGHTEFIRYVQERGQLPLASEGWQMYQPPLYYLLTVGLLEVVGLSTADPASTLVLRALSGLIGLANLALVFLCLRRLFPRDRGAQVLGLFFAALLPAQLCLAHYITNEGLAAMLATATLYFTLRTLQTATPPGWLYGATGGCLGLAMLAKFSTVVLVPFVFGLLLWRALPAAPGEKAMKWRGLGLALAACALVCGWHFLRVWLRFGNPLVGNWSPESGFAWWQENGFTTPNYFLSFGRALTSPLFSGFDSLWNGLYSTLWADGLCSGGARIGFRPPWNYSLMVAGVWLALVPSALIVTGFVALLWRWLRQPGWETVLWPGLLAAYGLAIATMTLRVPSYAQAKAVYALAALLPLGVCLLTGLEIIGRGRPLLRRISIAFFLVWGMNSYVSLWIRSGTAETHLTRAVNDADEGRPAEALAAADRALAIAPESSTAAAVRCAALRSLGQPAEAKQQAEAALGRHPHDADLLLELATLAAGGGDNSAAAILAGQAADTEPDHPQARHNAALWNFQAGRMDDAILHAREALRIRFAEPATHFVLGSAWATRGNYPEALTHLRLARQFKPDWPLVLNELAWRLAIGPRVDLRDGPAAVLLAERACQLTGHQQPQYIGTLAAAYAEAGQFPDAIAAAESARDLARANGQEEIARRNEQLLELYRAGKPYHETTEAGTRN